MKRVVINHREYPIHVPTVGVLDPGPQELDLDDDQIRYLENVPQTVLSFMPEIKTRDKVTWKRRKKTE